MTAVFLVFSSFPAWNEARWHGFIISTIKNSNIVSYSGISLNKTFNNWVMLQKLVKNVCCCKPFFFLNYSEPWKFDLSGMVNIVSFSYCVNNISVKRFCTYPAFPVIKMPSREMLFLCACVCVWVCVFCSLSWAGPKH